MSACIVVKTKSRIVLASDSRSSIKDGYLDGFKKIVYLKKSKIAFISAGQNTIDGQPVTDFMEGIDEEISKIKDFYDKCSFVADTLQKFIFDKAVINVCICRYVYKSEAYYFDIIDKKISDIKEVDFSWHNRIDVMDKLYIRDNALICDLSTYSEEQIKDFIRHIIEAEKKYQQYCGLRVTVGGDIQFLTLDKEYA